MKKFNISLPEDAAALDAELGEAIYCVVHQEDYEPWEVGVDGTTVHAGDMAYDILTKCMEDYQYRLN